MTKEYIRTEMLLGKEGIETLANTKVAIFGIGGVGSFVVEALARCGVGHLVLVDFDDIARSNINRQIHALQSTIGKSKVEMMKKRIEEINPSIRVSCMKEKYTSDNAEELLAMDYDYIVDAIDMVSSKIDLILRAKKSGIPIISSMGTGNKLNPTMLEVDDLFKTSMDPLARVMRRELKRRGVKNLKVVYSKEKPITSKLTIEDATELKGGNRQPPGSISFVPSAAGLIIASEVVKDVISRQ